MPERIVALSSSWADTVIAFGRTPVGVGSIAGISTSGGHFPWQGDYASTSITLTLLGAPAYEQIAALAPDLILADYSARDAAVYNALSAIAPTIAPLASTGYVDPWRAQVSVLGQIFNETDRAERLITDTDNAIADVARRHPNLAGRTFLIATARPGTVALIASDTDPAAALFVELGMRMDSEIVAQSHGVTRTNIAVENALPMMGADLLLIQGQAALLEASIPVWGNLPAVRSGAVAHIDGPLSAALSDPSVLAIAYLLRALEPQLRQVGSAS
ncbi:ABC transporter substrate-binding protein [Rhodococcus qingshengii]|uniref:ABC transporter substrate-binding protein n=1 Tax=Rhodococcus qingshengii TaxID=334542 RepID=UPI0022B2D505|nr:ABC transporter substrate-binding protein [Rhodococcus qingshengii]MCZ4618318.1 ABC transporter substrate-binding protein [Rhodococcus qingshengii]